VVIYYKKKGVIGNCLDQEFQEVKGDLNQYNQIIGGSLIQDEPKIDGDLTQGFQELGRCLS
jgi:hypothetical protein